MSKSYGVYCGSIRGHYEKKKERDAGPMEAGGARGSLGGMASPALGRDRGFPLSINPLPFPGIPAPPCATAHAQGKANWGVGLPAHRLRPARSGGNNLGLQG